MFVHCSLVILILTLGGQVHTEEISGGHEAAAHSRPYMALLKLYTQNKKTKHCGGFLLNEDFVMTAAHCQAESYNVLLGVHDIHNTDEIQTISVEQACPHKDYNAANYMNDIMLLKLSSKANISQNVKPIDLAGQSDGSLPKSCSVSGWGKTSQNAGPLSNVLMEVNVTLIDSKQCAEKNSYCSEGGKGPCPGDSGGPLVCEDVKAYGVVSAGITQNNMPIKYFVKIPDYSSWIDSVMKHEKCVTAN
ncbi:granzyme G-like [Chaetodon trifascialis]|uniref:granzyme G-like n=1 Tax=Chaetodon trifascialis TaxID=109706 RepID=UPI003995107A